MNNGKITLADVAAHLAQQNGLTKKSAALFIQQFVASVEEALLKDGDVKVKGLGVFKIEWHESRMSVNVQTGEKYEIPGHNKITFTPDKSIRDTVNKPFEHLEPIIVNKERSTENDTWKDEEELRLKRFSEQAQEILGIIADLQDIQPVIKNQETPAPKSLIDAVEHQQEPKQLETSATIEMVEQPSKTLPSTDTTSTTNIVQEEIKRPAKDQPLSSVADETFMMERMAKQAPTKNTKWMRMSILLAVIVVLCLPVYYYFFLMNHGDNAIPSATTSASSAQTPNKTVTAPSISSVQPLPTKAPQVIPKQPEKTNPLTQPRLYKETLATETFTEGSRLTLMALKYFGNKLFWVYIYEANKDKITNPDCILAGTRIRIPKLDPKLIDVHNPQCLAQASALQTAYKKQHTTNTK